MKEMDIYEIAKAVSGKIIKEGNKSKFSKISTDSRKIEENDVYIGLIGENFNGNSFAIDAFNRGAGLCIISEGIEKLNNTSLEKGIILVNNTEKALQDLASYYLNITKTLVIGVTGSTGKTSTKDLVSAALSFKFNVYKTKGNFNNEIGLPLTILSMPENTEVCVLEMGMSNFNEISKLASIAKPNIAIITNIGMSHIENLKTRENILKAKMEITEGFNKDNALIVNRDNDLLKNFNSSKFKVYGIGIESNDSVKALDLSIGDKSISFVCLDNDVKDEFRYTLNIPGKHNVLNAMLAIKCAKLLGLTDDEVQKGFNNLEQTSMRLDIIKENGYTIINDCYNASPDSMKAAIEVLKNMEGSRYIAVFGPMNELGNEAVSAHKLVNQYLHENKIDKVYSCGKNAEHYIEGFKDFGVYCSDIHEIITRIKEDLKEGDIYLIKASRTYKFETIVEALASKRN